MRCSSNLRKNFSLGFNLRNYIQPLFSMWICHSSSHKLHLQRGFYFFDATRFCVKQLFFKSHQDSEEWYSKDAFHYLTWNNTLANLVHYKTNLYATNLIFSEQEWFTYTRCMYDKITSRYASSLSDYVKYYFHMFIQFKIRILEIISKNNRLFQNK